MSRTIRKQLFSTLETLKKANQILEKLLNTNEQEALIALLTDCQECAITIGNQIEGIYGNDLACIHVLEEYCEAIYQIATGKEQSGRTESYALALQKLEETENLIEQEIPNKQEVVFFPYKASMWDSLESVYLSAKEDETCEVYCVPIPYFDRNADGSLGEMHYEGKEYPANIEITDWEQYDFEKRRPDVVYIHNPYDASNFVTCVHPKYFSSNLKKYTEKLVYIPYFVLEEIEPDNQETIDSMKHFCFLPGVIYADRVIVQSEKMRQIYINEYIKAAQMQGIPADRKQLEEKILGLGSPKLDKVLNTKREDLDVPEEWMKIIQKSDGSRKKIIFYNTSINGVLQNDEKMLDKMEDVFRIFKENQDEVALLWRPHPLIKSTIQSMRPRLWARYEKIVERYQEEGWGIYDDTADMDRAVVLSDAYYGDMSSVVQLYQKTGKQVMIQEIYCLSSEIYKSNLNKQRKIEIADALYTDNQIWYCAHNFNGLFSMDLKTNIITFHGCFPEENYSSQRLYLSMKLVGNKIFFAPLYAKSVAVFDIKSNQFYNFKLDEQKMNCKFGMPLFIKIEQYKNYLFMLPKFSKAILRFNLNNNNIDYITEWSKQVDDKIFNEEGYFRKQALLQGDKIIVPFCNANAVMEFNCNTMRCYIYELGTENRGYSGICFDGEKYWLSSKNYDCLTSWDMEGNNCNIVPIHKIEVKEYLNQYIGILYINNDLVVFSSMEEDNNIGNITKNIRIENGRYSFVIENNDVWMFYQYKSGKLTVIEKRNKRKTELVTMVNDEDFNAKLIFKEQENRIVEQDEINIFDLIRRVLM